MSQGKRQKKSAKELIGQVRCRTNQDLKVKVEFGKHAISLIILKQQVSKRDIEAKVFRGSNHFSLCCEAVEHYKKSVSASDKAQAQARLERERKKEKSQSTPAAEAYA